MYVFSKVSIFLRVQNVCCVFFETMSNMNNQYCMEGYNTHLYNSVDYLLIMNKTKSAKETNTKISS